MKNPGLLDLTSYEHGINREILPLISIYFGDM